MSESDEKTCFEITIFESVFRCICRFSKAFLVVYQAIVNLITISLMYIYLDIALKNHGYPNSCNITPVSIDLNCSL